MLSDTMIRLRKMFYRARGYYVGQLNGEPFHLDPYHSKFWRKANAGLWEPETFAVLDRFLSPEKDYVDIGAWIGPTVLYGARKARNVICFEPDATAYRHLMWNVELNGLRNVSAFPVAVSQEFGIARMASFGGEAGDSMTSLLHDGSHGTDVLTIGWDAFTNAKDLSNVSLVKMDVEGAEFDVLPTMIPWLKDNLPALYLSLHAPYLPEDQRTKRLTELFEALSFYGNAIDQNGAHLHLEDVLGDRYINKFPTVIFYT